MEEQIEFTLETTENDAKEEQKIANETNELQIKKIEKSSSRMDPLVEARFTDPVTMLVISSIIYVAKRIVDHWLKSRERGLLIDLQKDPFVVSRISGIPPGYLVIINKDGSPEKIKCTFNSKKDEDDHFSFLVQLIKSLLK